MDQDHKTIPTAGYKTSFTCDSASFQYVLGSYNSSIAAVKVIHSCMRADLRKGVTWSNFVLCIHIRKVYNSTENRHTENKLWMFKVYKMYTGITKLIFYSKIYLCVKLPLFSNLCNAYYSYTNGNFMSYTVPQHSVKKS